MLAGRISCSLFLATLLLYPATPLGAQTPRTDGHGDSLPAGAIARLGTIRWRTDGNITLATMLDATTALTVNDGHRVEIWDTASGTVKRGFDLGIPASPLRALAGRNGAISRDGKILAMLGSDRTISVWNTETGAKAADLAVNDVLARGMVLSPDGGLLAASSFQGGLQVWDTKGKDGPRSFKGGKNEGGSHDPTESILQFSPDGATLLQVQWRRTERLAAPVIVFWNVADGTEKRRITELPIPPNQHLSSQNLSVSPDQRFAAIWTPGAIILARLADGKAVGKIDSVAYNPACKYLFSPDSKFLIGAAGPDEPLTIWEVPGGNVVHQFGEIPDSDAVLRLASLSLRREMQSAVAPDGKTLLCTTGPALSLLDLETGKLRNESTGHFTPLKEAFYSADGSVVFTRGGDRAPRRWDARSGRKIGRMSLPKNLSAPFVSPDSHWLASTDLLGNVKLFDASTLKETRTLAAREHSRGYSIAFSPDSRLLARASSVSRTIELYDVASGTERTQLHLAGPAPDPNDRIAAMEAMRNPLRLAFAADSRLLAVASERLVTVWDLSGERQIGHIPLGEELFRHAAFSPDNRVLAIETSAGTSLWELATFLKRTLLHQYDAPARSDRLSRNRSPFEDAPAPTPLTFSPDGRLLACASEDRRIRLWDTWSGDVLTVLQGHRGPVHSAQFAPDGKHLVTSSSDTTAMILGHGADS